VAVDVASYYCAFLVVLGLLAGASRVNERLALGAILAGRVANMLPVATGNPDVRYTIQSIVVIAWGVTALALLARWPTRRAVAPGRAAAP
jgi:hypothetical protein